MRGKLSVRQDIINVILSRGELSKDEIKLMWGLDDEAYTGLKADLADEKLIERGPRESGGFAAKFQRRAAAADESPQAGRLRPGRDPVPAGILAH